MSRLKRTVAHVLVCTHKHCLKRGARDCAKELRERLKEHGLRRSVAVTNVDCLDQCDDGPVVCVYPDGVWYGEVDAQCARRIVEDHLMRGRTIERHVLHDIAEARAARPLLKAEEVESADDEPKSRAAGA